MRLTVYPIFTIEVIEFSFLRILENLICLIDFLETSFSFWGCVYIGVIFAGKLAVGFLYFRGLQNGGPAGPVLIT